jgi:hypothetical protein
MEGMEVRSRQIDGLYTQFGVDALQSENRYLKDGIRMPMGSWTRPMGPVSSR